MTRHISHRGLLAALGLVLMGQAATEQASSPQPPAASQPASAGSALQTLPSGANVAIIPVGGMIYDFTRDSLERRVDRALDAGASVIVIELDTYGGTVPAAMEISKYIKTIPVPTIAWVNNKAYSAGIMIASACDEIIMSPASATGDCAPIVPGMELPAAERAKALSPILEEFRDNARDNGYDFAPFHAMCVLGVEVYYVEHKTTGERRLVNQVDYQLMVDGTPDSGGHAWSTYNAPDPADPAHVGRATREVATDADIGMWKPVDTLPSGATLVDGRVHDGKTYLTMNQTRAQDIDISKATIGSASQLQQQLSAASVTKVPQTWSEDLAGFLTSMPVRMVLVIALMLGAYIEFQTPGVGIAGAVAVAALIVLLGAPFLVGLAEVWHIILFFIGFILLVIEVAFTPSFGILGIVGLVMMFTGLVLMAVPTGGGFGAPGFRLPPPEMWNRLLTSITYMTVALVASIVAFVFLNKYFGQIPGLNRLILQGDRVVASGVGTVDEPLAPIAGDEAIGEGRIAVGDTGRAATDLRPTGQADIDGQTIDVVSFGDWIERGQPIKVVEVHGNRIVVDRASS